MVSILINIIQHSSMMFYCKFSEICKHNFFIEHIQVTVFELSFANPRKKSEGTSLVKSYNLEGTSLVKLLQSCHFNIK